MLRISLRHRFKKIPSILVCVEIWQPFENIFILPQIPILNQQIRMKITVILITFSPLLICWFYNGKICWRSPEPKIWLENVCLSVCRFMLLSFSCGPKTRLNPNPTGPVWLKFAQNLFLGQNRCTISNLENLANQPILNLQFQVHPTLLVFIWKNRNGHLHGLYII